MKNRERGFTHLVGWIDLRRARRIERDHGLFGGKTQRQKSSRTLSALARAATDFCLLSPASCLPHRASEIASSMAR